MDGTTDHVESAAPGIGRTGDDQVAQVIQGAARLVQGAGARDHARQLDPSGRSVGGRGDGGELTCDAGRSGHAQPIVVGPGDRQDLVAEGKVADLHHDAGAGAAAAVDVDDGEAADVDVNARTRLISENDGTVDGAGNRIRSEVDLIERAGYASGIKIQRTGGRTRRAAESKDILS